MRALLLLPILILLVSCEIDWKNDDDYEQPVIFKHEIKHLDGVKLISPAITDANLKSTFVENIYDLDESRRLLIRFEDLEEHSFDIYTEDGSRVYLELTPAGGIDVEINPEVAEGMEICPLTTNWMMLATWYQAHPFVGGGWNSNGGDFDEGRCVSGTIPSLELGEVEDGYETANNRILFDITDLVEDYVKAMGRNYGWIIMSQEPVSFYGDDSSAYYPRLVWKTKW